MMIAILLIGWMVGALSTAIAILALDPGVAGAIAIFSATGSAAMLVAAMALAARTESPLPRAGQAA